MVYCCVKQSWQQLYWCEVVALSRHVFMIRVLAAMLLNLYTQLVVQYMVWLLQLRSVHDHKS